MNTAKLVDGDKTRRKRLKVVSACGECRRKKTKCNGEKPCAGCLKAHVDCKYVFTQKPNSNSSTTATVKAIIPIQEKVPSSPSSSTSEIHSGSIESIEERLGAIENILRTLLGSGKNKHLLQGLQATNNQQQQQHSDSLCGDMYSSSSPHLVHAPNTQNRRIAREKRKRHEDDQEGMTETKRLIRDDFGHGYNKLQLAPIKIMNPGTPTIRNLLNQEDTKWFPPQQQNNNSAFFRMSSSSPNTTTNSATTAAGSSS